MSAEPELLVAVVMGSKSDWESMKPASDVLHKFGIPHECRVLSAHRTPDELAEFMKSAEARGCQAYIGGAGGAAHLCGVIASQTLKPVLGVPMDSRLQGLDSLLSTVQMPEGIPVATFAIGPSGAANAALYAVAILSVARPELADKIRQYRQERKDKILKEHLPYKQSSAGMVPPEKK